MRSRRNYLLPPTEKHARLGIGLLAGCLAYIAIGCGGGDGAPVEAAAGGGQAGSAGNSLDASHDGSDAAAGSGGTAGHDSGADSDSSAGTGGFPSEAGDAPTEAETGSDTGALDADAGPPPCKTDTECTGNSAGPYCDTATGHCGTCNPAAPSTCKTGQYCDPSSLKCLDGCNSASDCSTDAGQAECDPATHQCVECGSDTHCALGQLCDKTSKSCVPGCNAGHGCTTEFACCSGVCVDRNADDKNCGTCGLSCSLPNAEPRCVAGKCVVDTCKAGFENCDQNSINGCETPASDAGSACLCNPSETVNCYSGPPGTEGVGACKGATKTCSATGTAWGLCSGEVVPGTETCFTPLDDDCDGKVNEEGPGCACTPNAVDSCYEGLPATRNVGTCTDGTHTCNAQGTAWGACLGQVLPTGETCLTPLDDNCDGQINEVGGAGCNCAPNSIQSCYGGPLATVGLGICKTGTQACDAMGLGYGPCTGDVVPSTDICTDALDNDCNGTVNDGVSSGVPGCTCFPLAVVTCYTAAPATLNVGVCKSGFATCNVQGSAYGACAGQVIPSTDNCTDSLDNDCNGIVNDGFGKSGSGCVCTPGATRDCYSGPANTQNVGTCIGGKSTCAVDGKSWEACVGETIPDLDSCLDGLDNDCNGTVNDGNHLAPGCACVPGAMKCVNGHEVTCNAQGDWMAPGGLCNQICKAGQFNCECNQVMQCDVGPPAKWVPKTTPLFCNAAAGAKCDSTTGTCKATSPIGNTTATGTYYRFANFTTSNSPLKLTGNVDDIDSYGDYLYVNRGAWYVQGIAMDVYKVTLLDTDGDGKLEPNQHPDNPLDPGPIEQRVLTFVATYTTAAPDNAPMGIGHRGEMYATADRVFMLSAPNTGDIKEYFPATRTSNVVAHSIANFPLSVLGYGEKEGKWFAGYEGARRVYSYCPAQQAWKAEFMYPNLAGSHMDGLEVIVAPATQTQYVYVSDMTSDFLGQYRQDTNGNWIQENLFQYKDVSGASVEGLGFGALNHFWIASGNSVYEIGGGDLSAYLQ